MQEEFGTRHFWMAPAEVLSSIEKASIGEASQQEMLGLIDDLQAGVPILGLLKSKRFRIAVLTIFDTDAIDANSFERAANWFLQNFSASVESIITHQSARKGWTKVVSKQLIRRRILISGLLVVELFAVLRSTTRKASCALIGTRFERCHDLRRNHFDSL